MVSLFLFYILELLLHAGVILDEIDDFLNISVGRADKGVGCTVVDCDASAIGESGTWEDYSRHIADEFVEGGRS